MSVTPRHAPVPRWYRMAMGSRARRMGTVAALAAAALTGCGTGLVASRPPKDHRSARAGAPSKKAERGWTVDPDVPLPAESPWWSVLGVARRFARAYLSYEVAAPGPGTRRALTASCTPAFARLLLSRPGALPPGVRAAEVRQVLVDVIPLENVAGRAMVLATVRATRLGGPSGWLELVAVRRAGGWRVAGMAVY